jgi:hypothetical protein
VPIEIGQNGAIFSCAYASSVLRLRQAEQVRYFDERVSSLTEFLNYIGKRMCRFRRIWATVYMKDDDAARPDVHHYVRDDSTCTLLEAVAGVHIATE